MPEIASLVAAEEILRAALARLASERAAYLDSVRAEPSPVRASRRSGRRS